MTFDNSFLLLGVILAVGALMGEAAERLRVPWITGCIFAGVLLGPYATGLLTPSRLASFGVFMQASLAFIAFNIGARLTAARLRSTGGDVAWLTFFQLLAPMITVLAALVVSRLSLPTAMIVAAVAPATAAATTYAVVKRRNAPGPFVDRALAILAINDAATILCFDVISAATVAWLGAHGSGDETWTALRLAVFREALSLLIGAGLGFAYLSLHALVAGGRPGWEHRLRAALYALLLLSVGAAIVFGLSNR